MNSFNIDHSLMRRFKAMVIASWTPEGKVEFSTLV